MSHPCDMGHGPCDMGHVQTEMRQKCARDGPGGEYPEYHNGTGLSRMAGRGLRRRKQTDCTLPRLFSSRTADAFPPVPCAISCRFITPPVLMSIITISPQSCNSPHSFIHSFIGIYPSSRGDGTSQIWSAASLEMCHYPAHLAGDAPDLAHLLRRSTPHLRRPWHWRISANPPTRQPANSPTRQPGCIFPEIRQHLISAPADFGPSPGALAHRQRSGPSPRMGGLPRTILVDHDSWFMTHDS